VKPEEQALDRTIFEKVAFDNVDSFWNSASVGSAAGAVWLSSHHAHDVIPMVQQQFSKVRTVLAGDPRN
jgi:hypothetical protein